MEELDLKKSIDNLYDIFINQDADEDVIKENKEIFDDINKTFETSELALSWRAHDYTKVVIAKAKAEYIKVCMLLATNEVLTESQRKDLFAKKKACMWVLSMFDKDPKQIRKMLELDVSTRLSNT